MPLFSAFCGGSSAERSGVLNAARTMNLYRTTIEADGTAATAYLVGTPGLKPCTTVPTGRGRGVYTQDGRTWTVVGSQLYELTIDQSTGLGTATPRGAIADDGKPVSWADNGLGGQQLAIVGGGELKILTLTSNVLSGPIVLPMSRAPVQIGYLDGYFVVSETASPRLWFSLLLNGLGPWDALDFFTRSTASDFVVAMACANNRIWVFGSETSEAYEDVGDADNPFQPIKGSLFPIGCVGPWTLSVGDTLRWVGQTIRGGAVVYRLAGYSGQRISTHAIEAQLGKATTLSDAEGLTYEQDGHVHYALTCPSLGEAGETHVIDETEGQWHQRSAWNSSLGREEAWRVRGHAAVGQRHVVGSRDSGSIWTLDLDTYDDDGQVLRAVRRAPYLGAENAWATIDAFELGVEQAGGLTSGQGSDPQVELRVSKDGAKTWVSAGLAPLAPMGQYDDRTYWTRLGRARIDRLVFETVITDPVKRILGPGAWLKITPGKAA